MTKKVGRLKSTPRGQRPTSATKMRNRGQVHRADCQPTYLFASMATTPGFWHSILRRRDARSLFERIIIAYNPHLLVQHDLLSPEHPVSGA